MRMSLTEWQEFDREQRFIAADPDVMRVQAEVDALRLEVMEADAAAHAAELEYQRATVLAGIERYGLTVTVK